MHKYGLFCFGAMTALVAACSGSLAASTTTTSAAGGGPAAGAADAEHLDCLN